MKATSHCLKTDSGIVVADINRHGQLCFHAVVVTHTQLQELIPYLQHASSCPPGQLMFTPEPMVWVKHNEWTYTCGEYTIHATGNVLEWTVLFRGMHVADADNEVEAMSAADRHRESH